MNLTNDELCHFNERIVNIKDLEANHTYFFRITAGTIIGLGEKSDIVVTPRVPGVISTTFIEPVCNLHTQSASTTPEITSASPVMKDSDEIEGGSLWWVAATIFLLCWFGCGAQRKLT